MINKATETATKRNAGKFSHPRERWSWYSMKDRCLSPKSMHFHRYGGRGIRICERWMVFANFLEDMGPRPEGHSLDRIDTDGDYEPNNCRWATQKQQSINRKSTRFFEYKGERLCIEALASRAGLAPSTLWHRIIARGWDLERALTTPPRKYKKSTAS